MKKFFCLLISILIPLCLAACGSDEGGDNGAPDEQDYYGENLGDESGESDESEQENFQTVEYFAQNGDNAIYGKLYVPFSEEEKLPVVILSHSASLTADSMSSYCKEFARRGFIAYAFDFCGGSSDSRSDGEQTDMTVFTEVQDLKAVIDAIKTLDNADPDRIYLFGTSQGGLVSALTANDCADDIEGLILLYPAFNIAELAEKYGSLGISFGGTGEEFVSTLLGYDVYEHIAGFKGRVLILHGSNDFIVDSEYSERAAELYESCELYIIQGASHGFNSENYSIFGNYDDEVWEYIDEYFGL